jgi:ligand-binding sensor domain-containing protein
MTEAADGAIWFGVDDGVVRYDGGAWRAFTAADGLLGKAVNVLASTSDGSIYAGTEQGISRYQGGGWTTVFPIDQEFPWLVNSLTETSDGSLWAGTVWGALRLQDKAVTLNTTEDVAVGLRPLAPDLFFTIVPDAVVPT